MLLVAVVTCFGLGCLINKESGMGLKPKQLFLSVLVHAVQNAFGVVPLSGSPLVSVKVHINHSHSNIKQRASGNRLCLMPCSCPKMICT